MIDYGHYLNISTLTVYIYTYATTMEEGYVRRKTQGINPALFLCIFLASLSATLANA